MHIRGNRVHGDTWRHSQWQTWNLAGIKATMFCLQPANARDAT